MSTENIVNRSKESNLESKLDSNQSYSAVHETVHEDNEQNDSRAEFRNQHTVTMSMKDYKEYGYRWIVMITFFLAILVNGIPYETCIPIAKLIHNIYGVSDSVISLTATLYMFMHPIFTFLASALIVNKGFAFSVITGCIITIIGLAIRLLVNVNFTFVLVGQVFCGIGRPLILNSQASMAQNWFFLKSRTLVLTLANMISTISIVLSLMIPGNIVFKNYNSKVDDGKQFTFNLMLYELICGILVIPTIFLLKNSPATPPSGFANTDVAVPLKQTMAGIFKNRSFILTFLSNSFYFGSLKGLGVVIPYLLNPFEYNAGQIANAGSLPILGGLVSSLFISTIVQKVGKYKPIALCLMFLSLTFMALLYPALQTKLVWVVYLDSFLIGFFLVPLIPVMLELSCEIIYPLSGSFAVGMLFSGSTLFTVVSSQILTVVTQGNESTIQTCLIGCICIVGILLLGFLQMFFVKEVRNRTNEVKQRKLKSTLFFKSSVVSQYNKSRVYDKFQSSELDQAIGEYPTYHPFVDQMRFISDPEQLNPDVIRSLKASIQQSPSEVMS